jgi:HKD family nuclease
MLLLYAWKKRTIMAKATFILQAISNQNHSHLLKSIFSTQLEMILISVAFAKTQGVNVIADSLRLNSKNAKIFVGIRNDITSYQAIEMLLDTGAEVYTVDTGSRNTIFHPKIYLAKNKKQADVVIGSANLTFNGLHNNIESSSVLSLNLDDKEDAKFFNDAVSLFDSMPTSFPEHVLKITNKKTIKDLFLSGRLTDETVVKPKSTGVKKVGYESIQLMRLYKVFPVSPIKKKINNSFVDEIIITQDGKKKVTETKPISNPTKDEFYLVWQSKELKERDLNIPTGPNTNATGSMYWKKGAFDDIDQRHHFRNDVFADVDWHVDSKLSHYERAEVKFFIQTKGESQGEFTLKISHNNDTNSSTYKQNNSMTNVSWGEAKKVIAKKDLLGRILYLYRKDSSPPEYMISID